jgi:uncharacterized membrane protein HdeD (DUF308 family)
VIYYGISFKVDYMIPGLGSLNWKTSILTGLFAVIVGFFALLFPSIAGPFLLLLVAFVVIVTSIGLILTGYSVSEEESYLRWPLMVIGVLLFFLGCIVIIFPQESATIVVYVIAIWAIVMGFQNMILSITYAETRKGLLALKGIISTIFGLLILFYPPLSSAVLLLQVFGIYLVFLGVLSVIVGLMERSSGE